jgi:3-oxoacyl-[acyl-carrier-protein] synthase II
MDVAITGLGIISSIGQDFETFGDNLAAGHAKIGAPPWSNEPEFENVWGSWIEDFDPHEWMDERVVDGTDSFARFAIAAAVAAVRDAGFEAPPEPLRTATVMGTSMGGVETLGASQHGLSTEGPEGISRKLQIQAWSNMAAGQIALRWGLHGPLLTLCTACASSLDAVGLAARMIASGQCDYAIAGGSDAGKSPLLIHSAARFRMFAPQPDPSYACRPFDVNRKGIMVGEGGGVVFLERADLAEKRGADIRARIRGYASLSDAYHPSSPDPSAQWEIRTMEMALQEADLPRGPEAVDAVIAHGTGTPVGDTAEIRAINTVFGERVEELRVASIKGHVGHTAGAAGVMGLLAGIHCMEHDQVVPVANTTDLDPDVTFRVGLGGQPVPGKVDTVQVNAFGFGGQDASVVMTRA